MGKGLKQRQVKVAIEALSRKGNGVGVYQADCGQEVSVEVPFSIPGDTVETTLLRKKRGRYQGKLELVTIPSKDRISPKCAHFGVCGGCRWQQQDYSKQLEIKQKIIANCFSSLISPDFEISPIIPCENPWEYRNKMEFSFSNDLSGNNYLGLMMNMSRGRVLNLEECHLVTPWFTQALKEVREWWNKTDLTAYFPPKNTGALRTLTLREGQRTGDRMVMLTVSGNPDYAIHKKQLEQFTQTIVDKLTPETTGKLSVFLRIHQIAKGKPTEFYEILLHGPDQMREVLHIAPFSNDEPKEILFKVSPSAFFQPNTRQAELLYSYALQMASIPKEGVVYDLYCGTGTLGICCAPWVKQVVGIELSPESALDARTNAADNNLTNVEIIGGSVQDKLKEVIASEKYGDPDLVVVDPPRVGLDKEALKQLVQLNPPKILYISCNPETQADNIADLIVHGYKIRAIRPVDQFPHTVHVENIVVLEK